MNQSITWSTNTKPTTTTKTEKDRKYRDGMKPSGQEA